jgi:site-specific recombinase
MKIFKSKQDVSSVLAQISVYEGEELDLLATLVLAIRPTSKERLKGDATRFDEFVQLLKDSKSIREGLRNYLIRITTNQKISATLTDANIISGIDFWSELWDRLSYKFLPDQPEKGSIDNLIVNVFYQESDSTWVRKISEDKADELLDLLEFKGIYEYEVSDFLLQEVLFAINVLSLRITGNAFESEVLRMVPEYANHKSPFAALQSEISRFINGLEKNTATRKIDDEQYKQIQILNKQCRDFITTAYANKEKYGISFKVHQQLMLMERLLDRLFLIFDLIIIDPEVRSETKMLRFVTALIDFNSGKSKVSGYINKSTQIMANEITRNIGIKGEQYITKTSRQYWNMLKTASGGGVIVALACIIKMNLSSVEASLFVKAFLYSMNYAFAFIAIYLLHFTLATKQPAMTAATLAQAIEEDQKTENDFVVLSQLVARVWRSQFIAFVGNVFLAFPVALGLLYGWGSIFETNPASHKAVKMIYELNVFASPAIFHAAIAGVFLFISGMIAGHVSNKTKYRRVPERIKEHPVLKQIFNPITSEKLASFYEHNWGGIVSNFWFGVFMGSVSTVGIILGIDLDIRHITFAAGNFGLALYGVNFVMTTYDVVMSIIGIGLIGFTNFIVSFTLSMMLALRSRGIPFRALTAILRTVFRYFFRHPVSFFFPTSMNRQLAKMEEAEEDLAKE